VRQYAVVIFDLDLTLVDSRSVLKYQQSGKWRSVFAKIPEITPYEGISELLSKLHSCAIPIAIVTSSPDQYCKAIARHQGWHIDVVIGYHNTTRRKPHPDPINLALQYANITPEDAVHIGDRPEDTKAAKAAGVFSIGAIWGTLDAAMLSGSEPELLCRTVADLVDYLNRRFKIA